KKTGLILLLISSLILSQISISAAYAEGLPEVQYYKMISADSYLNMYTVENEIGIIIGFDSLQDIVIDPGTTYVLLNLTIDDPDAGLAGAMNVETFRIDGVDYFPGENELLFKFDYSNQFPLDLDQGLNLIKVEEVVINAATEIPVNMGPQEGFRVYHDDVRPYITGAKVVENESNEIYYYNDTIKIEISFNEPVAITEDDLKNAFKIKLWDITYSFVSIGFSFSSYSVNGVPVDAVYGSNSFEERVRNVEQ
ncbi:MAG: hypothetical protein GX158_08430, partial [Bacteroidales bacterium]|nr:hypothetical protein [Bacteroidales bacterium]